MPLGQKIFVVKRGESELNGFIMYHGTNATEVGGIIENGFNKCTTDYAMLGKGIYVSRNPDKARTYGDIVLKVCLQSMYSWVFT